MKRKSQIRPLPIRLASIAAFLLIWQIAGTLSGSLSVPTFSDTLLAWWNLIVTGELPAAIMLSISAMVLGLLAAIAAGSALGLAMGWFRLMEEALEPYMQILLVIPMMALVPVIVVLFGFTVTARATVVFLFAVVIITLNIYTGVRTVDRSLVEMSKSFGISQRQLFLKILLPGSTPAIIAGIRLGIGRAFVGMVAAEMMIASAGFGNLLVEYKGAFKPHYVFAIVLTIIVLSLIVTSIAKTVESRLLRWNWNNAAAE